MDPFTIYVGVLIIGLILFLIPPWGFSPRTNEPPPWVVAKINSLGFAMFCIGLSFVLLSYYAHVKVP